MLFNRFTVPMAFAVGTFYKDKREALAEEEKT
jgi:hypothetical protein